MAFIIFCLFKVRQSLRKTKKTKIKFASLNLSYFVLKKKKKEYFFSLSNARNVLSKKKTKQLDKLCAGRNTVTAFTAFFPKVLIQNVLC